MAFSGIEIEISDSISKNKKPMQGEVHVPADGPYPNAVCVKSAARGVSLPSNQGLVVT